MGWLIALAVLVLLGCLPLGVRGIYAASGATADLLIGPVKIRLLPGKKKEKKPEKPKEKKPAAEKKPTSKQEEKKGGSFTDFLPLVKVATDFLGDLRRKIRIKRLEMHLCMAGGDPCDLGINYGRAWAAVGNLMPQLERLFVIKKRDIQVACDFTQSQTTVYVRADITITLGRLLGLLLRYGWRGGKEFLKIINKRKDGTVK
ncbi:MAG: DUF2953 domain-containing protein [Ruminococcaceae bacterium]|nr:DUF2953 domain-containing protein [Oscillospiraceae bacterium]